MYEQEPTRKMPNGGNAGNGGVDCAEFEVLLADALDGRLDASGIERFDAHLSSCARCAPMFGEAKLGQSWLATLKTDELDVPDFVVDSILRETIGTVHQKVKEQAKQSWLDRLKEKKWFEPVLVAVRQPRFAMSFGMAFFSVTMLLNVMGVKVSTLAHVDLRPAAISKTYHEATARIVKYYENIRFVYEIESRIKDLKQSTEQDKQDEAAPKQDRKPENGNPDKNAKPENRETSGAPELKPNSDTMRAANAAGAAAQDSPNRSLL